MFLYTYIASIGRTYVEGRALGLSVSLPGTGSDVRC